MSRGQIRRSETIGASPAAVFAVLTDISRSPEWDPTVTKVTQMTRGPLRKGVILRGTLDVEGQSYHVDDEVTDFDPPWHFGLRSVQGGADGIAYTLTAVEAGTTRLDAILSYELPDPPPDVVGEPSPAKQLDAGLARTLCALKDLIERETARPT